MTGLLAWLESYLAPVGFAGETVRFDLSTSRSRVTREMLQARLRRTPAAFGVSATLLAANLTPDEGAVEVDASTLLAINDVVTHRLEQGPAGAIDALRRLDTAAVTLAAASSRLAAAVGRGQCPSRAVLLACLAASAQDQALGSLKFCLPASLRPTLAAWFGDEPELLEALLSPADRSLWSRVKARELALAASRRRGPAAVYLEHLHRFRRAWGYLEAEDVDFRAGESEAAIDARVAALGAPGARDITAQQRRLRAVLDADRIRKLHARRVFAERLAAGAGGERAARLVSQVLLARALAAHEDHNRRRKMRLLRDLRDVAELAQLPLETASLFDFAQACKPFVGEDLLVASVT